MKNKYRNKKTGQIVYSDFMLDEKKFEPIAVKRNTKMKTTEVIAKGRKNKKKNNYAKK